MLFMFGRVLGRQTGSEFGNEFIDADAASGRLGLKTAEHVIG